MLTLRRPSLDRLPTLPLLPFLVLLLLLPLLATTPTSTAAQLATGTVTDATTGEPLDAALVVLLDEDATRLTATLTDPGGRFRLLAPEPGVYRVRVEHIGYAAAQSEPVELERGQTVRLSLTATVRPIDLEGVVVEGEARCEANPSEGELTAQLWDEARKALSVARWADEAQLLRFRIERWRRRLDPETSRVLDEQRQTSQGLHTASPFVSLPASDLQRNGYIREVEGGGYDYFAPDPDALLSDAFLDAHCFRPHLEDPAEDGWVGLAFEPVERRRIADVVGVLWIDVATSELERMEYRYTRLPDGLRAARVGGSIDFDRIPEGPWIVRRWTIRMPVVGRRQKRDPRGRLLPPETYVESLVEEGGEVVDVTTQGAERAAVDAMARRPGEARWTEEARGEATETVLVDTHVTVRNSTTDSAVSGVSVRLDDRPWRMTDEQGLVSLGPIPAGVHWLELSHLAFGTQADTVRVEAPGPLHWIVELDPRAIAVRGFTVTVDADPERERSGVARGHLSRAELDELLPQSDLPTLIRRMALPGLHVRQVYEPGSSVYRTCLEFVRGMNTAQEVGCQMVMIVVDGQPIRQTEHFLESFDPSTIAELEFLPPTVAGARWGTGSENGVLVIRTRR